MKATEIVNYLDEIIPNPKCELNYNKDYELVIATMLSAQTTDKKVNEITKILFNNCTDSVRSHTWGICLISINVHCKSIRIRYSYYNVAECKISFV